jgi:hypothetical protein
MLNEYKVLGLEKLELTKYSKPLELLYAIKHFAPIGIC